MSHAISLGTLSRSAILLYMLKHILLSSETYCCPNWIFDSPTTKQKLEFLALVRYVKVAIQNYTWHVKLAIRNNKWDIKLAICNKTCYSEQYFGQPILCTTYCSEQPLSTFMCLTSARNFSFCLIVGLSKTQLGQQICL